MYNDKNKQTLRWMKKALEAIIAVNGLYSSQLGQTHAV